jgi:hypothetical protein
MSATVAAFAESGHGSFTLDFRPANLPTVCTRTGFPILERDGTSSSGHAYVGGNDAAWHGAAARNPIALAAFAPRCARAGSRQTEREE